MQLEKGNRTDAEKSKFSWLTFLIAVVGIAIVVMLISLICKAAARYGKSEDPVVSENAEQRLDADLDLTVNGSSFAGALSQQENGSYLLTVEQPEEVAGMTMQFDPQTGACAVSFLGLSAQLGGDSAFDKSIAALLGSALSDALPAMDGEKQLTGYLGEARYSIALGESGLPAHLSIPDYGIECDFQS
jgi:hypothetical protein